VPEVSSLYAPYERDGRFFCPWGMEQRGWLDVLRWRLRRPPARRRNAIEVPVVAEDGARLARVAERAEVTWIGHSSWAVHEGERTVLLDPHFGPRAFLPRRQSPPGLPLAAVPRDAVALLSHNHYDHLDAWTLARLPKTVSWLVPLGLERFVRSFGFERVRALGWWGTAEVAGWHFTFLPAQHWSNRFGQARDATLWGGWLLDSGRTRVLYGGDSGYFHGFAEFGRRFAPLAAALLPIGAYLPRWFMRGVHMSPEEALAAWRDTGARLLLPGHWGALDLADEALDEPPRELARQLGRAAWADLAPRVRIPAVGETVQVPG
jgi:N-acyl-phosphatidylethanolamine-hydrolysing phospholipase D